MINTFILGFILKFTFFLNQRCPSPGESQEISALFQTNGRKNYDFSVAFSRLSFSKKYSTPHMAVFAFYHHYDKWHAIVQIWHAISRFSKCRLSRGLWRCLPVFTGVYRCLAVFGYVKKGTIWPLQKDDKDDRSGSLGSARCQQGTGGGGTSITNFT